MPDTTQTLSTQITSVTTRIGQEFNAVRTEIATGGAPTSADKVTLADGKSWSAKKTNDSIAAVNTSVTTLATNVGDTTVDLVGTFEAALTKAGA